MKLAEALLERAELKQKIEFLKSRLNNNAKVQEGCVPLEEPIELMKELDQKLERMRYLIIHINKTNELTTKDGKTISELIATRDVLSMKLKALADFVDAGSNLVSRLSRTEIRVLPTFDVRIEQKNVDKIAADIRRIDTTIQELNWTTELE